MTADQKKTKAVEAWVLVKARELGAPFPLGEESGERPDFRIASADGTIGIELTEVLRSAIPGGLKPVHAAAVHEKIVRNAEELYRKTNPPPMRVQVFFADDRPLDIAHMAQVLVECVTEHQDRPGVVHLIGQEAPVDISQIVFWRDDRSCWPNVEHGGMTVDDIFNQIRMRILEKNLLAPIYRANLPLGSLVWLLLWSAVSVSRGLPIPYGLEKWNVHSEFDRVFFFSCLDMKIIELQMASH